MKKHTKKELSLPLLLLIGTAASILSVVLVSFVFALISSMTKNPTALTGIFSLVSLLFAGALSGFVISKVIRDGGSLIAVLSAVIAALLMSVIGLIVKGGAVPISVFLNYLAYLGTAALASFLATKTIKKRARFR